MQMLISMPDKKVWSITVFYTLKIISQEFKYSIQFTVLLIGFSPLF